jgi:hypothetical protein
MTTVLNHLDAAVDAVLARVQGPIVLGLPLGIGKPNPFVNRLYARMKADPSRPLTIITALSLEVPSGKSELEQHFLAPLVERVFKDYPDLAYVKDSRAGTLPPHIQRVLLQDGRLPEQRAGPAAVHQHQLHLRGARHAGPGPERHRAGRGEPG